MAKHETLGVYDYSRRKLCDLYDSQNDLIGQAYDIEVTKDKDGYHSLVFNIPYIIGEDEFGAAVENPALYGTGRYGLSRFGIISAAQGNKRNFRWSFLKSEYLIRYTCGSKKIWFVADKPEKTKSGKNIYGKVSCSGTEILLKTRNIYMEFDDSNGIGNVKYLMDQVLAGTGWHFSDAMSDTLYERDGETEKVRSLQNSSKQGTLGLITTICNLFQCRPVFDTDERIVYVKAMNNRQQVLEGEVGRNLQSLTYAQDSSNICTRLYVEGEYGDNGYVGIDDVIVDGEPYGLPFIMNFDYYKEIGVFTAEHQAALDTYMHDIRDVKQRIRENAALLISAQDQLNTMIGQCKMVLYYVDDLLNPAYIYGDVTTEQAILQPDDDVVILKYLDNKYTHTYKKWIGSSQIVSGVYGVAKFILPSSGEVGAAEVQVEAKEKNITKLCSKIGTYLGQCRMAFYYTSDMATPAYTYGGITSSEFALNNGDDVFIFKQTSSGLEYRFVKWEGTGSLAPDDYGVAKCIPLEGSEIIKQDRVAGYITEIVGQEEGITQIYTGDEETGDTGLYDKMAEVMKPDGLLHIHDQYFQQNIVLGNEQDEIEATFISAMGYLLRDGSWSNTNYVVGQEEFLYADALDMSKEMSRPTTNYSFSYVRVTEDFDVPAEDIEINAIFRIYDKELEAYENMFVTRITVGVDDKSKGTIEVSNQDITLTGNDLGSLLSRMSQLADLVEQKNALYERAKALTNSGTLYADRLNGQIDVMRTKILSSVSNWYTDDRGNMVFEAADGSSAMMLSGAGLMLASAKTDDGEWDWRSFGDGHGFTCEELVAGFISAERIEAGSITTNKLSAEVGSQLDISSNDSINLKIETIAGDVVDDALGYRIEVTASTDVLTEDTNSTTLTAIIWRGDKEVTASYAASKFNWKRVSDDPAGDTAWNNQAAHQGTKMITVACTDVNRTATFICEVSD